MKDINIVRLSGSVFWSKLDDRQSFSFLRLGVKINNGDSIFCTISNPDVKGYEHVKSGNKIILSNGWFDLWEKDNSTQETQIRTYGSGIQFFPKEIGLFDLNSVTILGTVIKYEEDSVIIEMRGERNPKTNAWAMRKVKIKIGSEYEDIIGKKIFLQGKIISTKTGDGKSKLVVEADYDKISIL